MRAPRPTAQPHSCSRSTQSPAKSLKSYLTRAMSEQYAQQMTTRLAMGIRLQFQAPMETPSKMTSASVELSRIQQRTLFRSAKSQTRQAKPRTRPKI